MDNAVTDPLRQASYAANKRTLFNGVDGRNLSVAGLSSNQTASLRSFAASLSDWRIEIYRFPGTSAAIDITQIGVRRRKINCLISSSSRTHSVSKRADRALGESSIDHEVHRENSDGVKGLIRGF
jgi:hypothetical protein